MDGGKVRGTAISNGRNLKEIRYLIRVFMDERTQLVAYIHRDGRLTYDAHLFTDRRATISSFFLFAN